MYIKGRYCALGLAIFGSGYDRPVWVSDREVRYLDCVSVSACDLPFWWCSLWDRSLFPKDTGPFQQCAHVCYLCTNFASSNLMQHRYWKSIWIECAIQECFQLKCRNYSSLQHSWSFSICPFQSVSKIFLMRQCCRSQWVGSGGGVRGWGQWQFKF